MQTKADVRLPETGPETQVHARKREQTQTNAKKRKIRELHPLSSTPFNGSPNIGSTAISIVRFEFVAIRVAMRIASESQIMIRNLLLGN